MTKGMNEGTNKLTGQTQNMTTNFEKLQIVTDAGVLFVYVPDSFLCSRLVDC